MDGLPHPAPSLPSCCAGVLYSGCRRRDRLTFRSRWWEPMGEQMSGSGGARVECTICGHAWRVTATDADRGSTWCDLCQEPRTMDGRPPIWLERGRSTAPAPEPAAAPAPSRPASGLGLLLKRSQPAAPPAAPRTPAASASSSSSARSHASSSRPTLPSPSPDAERHRANSCAQPAA